MIKHVPTVTNDFIATYPPQIAAIEKKERDKRKSKKRRKSKQRTSSISKSEREEPTEKTNEKMFSWPVTGRANWKIRGLLANSDQDNTFKSKGSVLKGVKFFYCASCTVSDWFNVVNNWSNLVCHWRKLFAIHSGT